MLIPDRSQPFNIPAPLTLAKASITPAGTGDDPAVLYDTVSIGLDEAAKSLLKNKVEQDRPASWSAGSGSFHPPALMPGGVCMVTGSVIQAHSSDGASRWNYDAHKPLSAPAWSAGGTTYVSSEGSLLAIDAGGKLLWNASLPVDADHPPAVGTDGTIYVMGKDNKLYALGADSKELWNKKAKPLIDLDPSPDLYTAPVATPDGGVVVANRKKYLVKFDGRGSRMWSCKVPGEVTADPTVDEKGNIAFGSYFDSLVVLNAKGRVKWQKSLTFRAASSPGFGRDGSVYIGDDRGVVHAFGPDGSVKWNFRAREKVMARPAVADDGTVYACSWFGTVYAIPPDGGKPRWFAQMGGLAVSPPRLAPDGTVFAVGAGGSLVAFNDHKSLSGTTLPEVEREEGSSAPRPGIEEIDGWIVIDGLRLPMKTA